GEPAVLGKQPLAMPDEAFWIRRKIGLERRYNRHEYAADAFAHGFTSNIKSLTIKHPFPNRNSFATRAHSLLPSSLYLLCGFPPSLHSSFIVLTFRAPKRSNGGFVSGVRLVISFGEHRFV